MDEHSVEYDLCMFHSVASCEEFVKHFDLHLEFIDTEYGTKCKFTNADGTLVLETACNPLENDGYMSYAQIEFVEKTDQDLAHEFIVEFEQRTESCK